MNKKQYDQKWELMICEAVSDGSLKVFCVKNIPVRLNDEKDDVIAKYKNKEYAIKGGIYSRHIVIA